MLVMLILLTNCTRVHSNSCGVLINYSEEDQKKAAIELQSLQKDEKYVVVPKMIDHYGITRDTIRACLK